jgi:2',3'-cyclic-nucleotide 2'-phosphodiesterase (5'-nucleotidase family)
MQCVQTRNPQGTCESNNLYCTVGYMNRAVSFLLMTALAASCLAQNPGTGAHLPSQAAADVIRDAAGTDGAFLAAGLVNESYDPSNLASLVQYPTEKLVVLNLKGADIRQAFQRSLSLYPQANTSFLQISGFSVEFSGTGNPANRILKVNAGAAPLDPTRNYTVAMPSGLASGGLGYFKIWDKSKISKTLDLTVEAALSGKPFVQSAPRWVLR